MTIHEPQLKPTPDPFFAVAEEQKPADVAAVEFPPQETPKEHEPAPAEFTGVRIYGDPQTCDPCRFLLRDLQFLRDNHDWTLSESATDFADWQFLPPLLHFRRFPLIEIYENGDLVDCLVGYSGDPEFAGRRDTLAELVARHPRNWKQ